ANRFAQHAEGFADSGRVAEKQLEDAARFQWRRRDFQPIFRLLRQLLRLLFVPSILSFFTFLAFVLSLCTLRALCLARFALQLPTVKSPLVRISRCRECLRAGPSASRFRSPSLSPSPTATSTFSPSIKPPSPFRFCWPS